MKELCAKKQTQQQTNKHVTQSKKQDAKQKGGSFPDISEPQRHRSDKQTGPGITTHKQNSKTKQNKRRKQRSYTTMAHAQRAINTVKLLS